jgi:hypothetical protein
MVVGAMKESGCQGGKLKLKKLALLGVTPVVLLALAVWDTHVTSEREPFKVDAWFARLKRA